MSALELAERALRAAEGDEALALVQSERSGMARYAGSEVHQPTLIENEAVELQVVRDGRLGIASSNRVDDEGLRALAARAAEAADNA
ncbi:MAG TPA: DNA gyrase modulator, partial [Gaiella sp.]